MRQLATIRTIDDIQPIPGADVIEKAVVGGWHVVVKKGEFEVGQEAIYLEIDSWVPHSLAPFLSKGQEPKEFEGTPGNRLRTVKLRGQISQGLLLQTSVVDADVLAPYLVSDAQSLDELLGIKKYEQPIPAQLAGDVRGPFPSFIKKTDQERIQNLSKILMSWVADGFSWEVTEKLDGSSMTVYVNGDDYGVCSRNLNLKEAANNTFWQVARKYKLIEKLQASGRNLALQGELCGPGIQGNRYGFKSHVFKVFDIYDIDKATDFYSTSNTFYLPPQERRNFCKINGIDHVPCQNHRVLLPAEDSINALLQLAEAKSVFAPVEREGLVFKRTDGAESFKVISNKFLLKSN